MVVVNDGHARRKENRTELQIANEVNLSRGEKNGYMSAKTRSKIKGYVDTLLFLSELPEARVMRMNSNVGYKQKDCFPTLVTLTLPSAQVHSDNFIKRYLLGKFIKLLKEKYNVCLYLWVAEPQLNGNIHFHILIDKFIENVLEPKYSIVPLQLTKDWNKILDQYGYIEPYSRKMRALHQSGFCYNPLLTKEEYIFSPSSGKFEISVLPISHENQLAAYELGSSTDWTQPNTADIHRLKEKDNIKAYICKYLTKSDGSDRTKRTIDGRLWGTSDQLRTIAVYEQSFDDDLQNAVLDLQNDNSVKLTLVTDYGNMDLQTFQDNELEGKVKVFATIYTYCQLRFWHIVSPRFKFRFETYYRNIFSQVYSTSHADTWSGRMCGVDLDTVMSGSVH